MMSRERFLLTVFLLLSIVAALTEGVGISMVVPILESQADKKLFGNVPLLREFSALFEGMDQVEKIQSVALVLGGVLLVRGVLLYFVELLAGIIPLRLQRDLYGRGYAALLKAEYSYFTEKGIGDHVNTLTELVLRATQLLTSFATAIYAAFLMVVYLVLMLTLSWELALAAAVFVSIIAGLLKLISAGPLHRAGEEMSVQNARLSETAHETMTGMKFIMQSAAEDIMVSRYNDRLGMKTDAQIKMVSLQALSNPFLVTSAGVFICTLLFISSYIQKDGAEEWLSGVLMFLFLLMRLLSPMSQINAARTQIFAHFFSLDMLSKFFKEADQREQQTGHSPFRGIRQGIQFDNVEFQYPQSDEKAIKGLTMEVEAGQMVAIVGPSGSGKSTLVALLTRFFDLQEGCIKIDGIDLREIDIHDLRRSISVVSQDIFIFNDTVTNNLLFATEGKNENDARTAAKLAAAEEFISAMPQGFDTKLGDRGVRLSGGQQQRIAIARAILRDPGLLILDEATSQLDTFTEQAVQSAVEALRSDRTILVIAHRLSTIRKADKVVVMNDGQVVEQGTHDQLMAEHGVYWQMVSQQNLDLIEYDDVAAPA